MTIRFESGYILIISPKLLRLLAIGSGAAERAKGAAVFPFIFVKSEEFAVPWLINHERIHFRQQMELLFIGSFLLNLVEQFHYRFILKMSGMEAYLWSSSEQEAYLNHHNLHYLKNRKLWARFRYMTHKKKFIVGKPGEVIFH